MPDMKNTKLHCFTENDLSIIQNRRKVTMEHIIAGKKYLGTTSTCASKKILFQIFLPCTGSCCSFYVTNQDLLNKNTIEEISHINVMSHCWQHRWIIERKSLLKYRWIYITSVPLVIGSVARTKPTRFSNIKTELGTQLKR